MKQGASKVAIEVTFVLAMYCWACTLHLKIVCFPSDTPLEKTKFPFASGCQLETTSELWMEASAHFYFQF